MERKILEKEGYVVVKNFLNSSEVKKLRTLCLSDDFQKKEGVILGDVIAHDNLRELVFPEKLTVFLKKILGEDGVYIGDGTARGDDKPLSKSARKFHSDSRADDFNFEEDYPLYRFGLYLQDTDCYSGGLKIRPRSHKKLCVDHGSFLNGAYRLAKYIQKYKRIPPVSFSFGKNLSAKAGDLLVWNMRLHHSGHAVRLKGLRNLSLYPLIENWIPQSWRLPQQDKRCVVFFAFGKKSRQLENYYHYIKEHPDNTLHWKNSRFSSSSLKEYLIKNNLKILLDIFSYQSQASKQRYQKGTFF